MAQPAERVATSEQDCAIACNYDYIQENELSFPLERQQQRSIQHRKVLDGLYPPPCACDKSGDRWCFDHSCDNWSNNVACSPNCGDGCMNNPFKNNGQGFAAGRNTYLETIDGKGKSIHALNPIPKDTFIGTYNGIVYASGRVANEMSEYLMDFDHVPQTIDGEKKGSICTRVNHSCVPNCVPYSYVHERQYKVVFVAKRNIRKDEELTVNYGWTYELGGKTKLHDCLCGVKRLGKHTIEKLRAKGSSSKKLSRASHGSKRPARDTSPESIDDASRDDPPAPQSALPLAEGQRPDYNTVDNDQPLFGNVLDSEDAQVEQQVNMPVDVLPRPPNYEETHIFRPREVTFVIAVQNGVLQVLGGRVIECYRNRHGVRILAVRTNIDGIATHYIPRWICFHHAAEAVYRLSTFNDIERRNINDYSRPIASRTRADGLVNHMVPHYINNFLHRTLPVPVSVQNSSEGGPSIGRLPVLLYTPGRVPEGSILMDQDERPAAEQEQQGQGNSKKSNCRAEAMDNPSDDAPEDAEQDEQDEEGEEDMDEYDANHRRGSVRSVRSSVYNQVLFHRIIDYVVENVTLFALSRLPRERTMTYTNLREIVRQGIQYFYTLAAVEDRRFMRFTHFRFAVEVESTGAWNNLWCSLCRLRHTFTTVAEFRQHFERHHALISASYTCPNCQASFTFPSEFRRHVVHCTPEFASTLVSTVSNFILDSYSDYFASRDPQFRPLYFIAPGMPSLSRPENSGPSHQSGKKVKPLPKLRMNRRTGKPIDKKHVPVPAKIPIQQKYTEIKQWRSLTYSKGESSGAANVIPCVPAARPEPPARQDRVVVDGMVIDDEQPGHSRNAKRPPPKKTAHKKGTNANKSDSEEAPASSSSVKKTKEKPKQATPVSSSSSGSCVKAKGKPRKDVDPPRSKKRSRDDRRKEDKECGKKRSAKSKGISEEDQGKLVTRGQLKRAIQLVMQRDEDTSSEPSVSETTESSEESSAEDRRPTKKRGCKRN